MRAFCILVLLAINLLFSCGANTPEEATNSFSVHIGRSSMLNEYSCCITTDSLFIKNRNRDHTWDTFVKYWNDTEKTEIAAMVNSWNVNDLLPGPPTTNTDCDSEFTFELERNGKRIWHEDVYKEKVDHVFELTNYVDNLLPPQFRINYNGDYLAR